MSTQCVPVAEATGEFLVEHDAFQLLCRDQSWQLQWMKLYESCMPLLSVAPEVIPVIPLDEALHNIWPLPKATRKRKTCVTTEQTLPLQPSADQGDDYYDVDQGDVGELPGEVPEDELCDDDAELEQAIAAIEALEDVQSKKRKVAELQASASATGAASSSSHMPMQTGAGPIHDGDEAGQELRGTGAASSSAGMPPPGAEDMQVPRPDAVPPEAEPVDGGNNRPQEVPNQRPGPRGGGLRLNAAAVVSLADAGSVSYYINKNAFQATCSAHRGCILTRTSKGRRDRDGSMVGGRPIGGWLRLGQQCPTKEQHWAKQLWEDHLSQAVRTEARAAVSQQPDGPMLMQFEREREATEPEEAPTLAGLLR